MGFRCWVMGERDQYVFPQHPSPITHHPVVIDLRSRCNPSDALVTLAVATLRAGHFSMTRRCERHEDGPGTKARCRGAAGTPVVALAGGLGRACAAAGQ